MEKKHPAGDRIAKVLARRGVASRRAAEAMISEGRVAVNGTVVDSPALNVGPRDRIEVDGKPLPDAPPSRLWLYHKPPGLVTTASDDLGRSTVFDALPPELGRVMSVGRLDISSEGLLLLTNDGAIKRRLELPSTGWLRRYRVRVNGTPDDASLEPLRRGIEIDGERFRPMEARIDRQQGANAWLTVGLREGRNREVRRAMEAVGLTVNRLIRIGYGPFRLGELAPGAVEEVRPRVLRDQLGLLPEAVPDAPEAGPREGGARPGVRTVRRAPDAAATGEGGSAGGRPRRAGGTAGNPDSPARAPHKGGKGPGSTAERRAAAGGGAGSDKAGLRGARSAKASPRDVERGALRSGPGPRGRSGTAAHGDTGIRSGGGEPRARADGRPERRAPAKGSGTSVGKAGGSGGTPRARSGAAGGDRAGGKPHGAPRLASEGPRSGKLQTRSGGKPEGSAGGKPYRGAGGGSAGGRSGPAPGGTGPRGRGEAAAGGKPGRKPPGKPWSGANKTSPKRSGGEAGGSGRGRGGGESGSARSGGAGSGSAGRSDPGRGSRGHGGGGKAPGTGSKGPGRGKGR